MGRTIREVSEAGGHELCAALDLGDSLYPAIESCDVAIDFSFHSATLPLARAARETGKALVIGTTGHTPEEKEAIRAEASGVPTVWAGNYSIGINLLYFLTGKAAAILGLDYSPEVVEMHHRHKRRPQRNS